MELENSEILEISKSARTMRHDVNVDAETAGEIQFAILGELSNRNLKNLTISELCTMLTVCHEISKDAVSCESILEDDDFEKLKRKILK